VESVEDEQRVIDNNSDEDGKVIQGLIAWYQEDLGRRGLERKKFALTMAQVDEFVAHDHFISTKISDSRASSVSSPHPPSSKRESPSSSPASSTS
jgi:hypothetical protein